MEQWHRGLTADMFVIRDGQCGLVTRDVQLLRVWAYPVEDYETVHATYVGYSLDGEVELVRRFL